MSVPTTRAKLSTPNAGALEQGSLKDTFCPFEDLKHGFFHQNKVKPPFTRQCSGVRIPVEYAPSAEELWPLALLKLESRTS